jgi:hypothetical protein
MRMEDWWNDMDWETKVLREKPAPVLLSIKNLTWAGMGSNPVLCSKRPATIALKCWYAHNTTECHEPKNDNNTWAKQICHNTTEMNCPHYCVLHTAPAQLLLYNLVVAMVLLTFLNSGSVWGFLCVLSS